MNKSCYYCGSVKVVKNGKTCCGKARGKCKDCSRQFVSERQNRSLGQEQKRRTELLLLEGISLEGICRALETPAYRLYRYLDELYEEVPGHYRQRAIFFTDGWEAYKKVTPAARHVASARKKDTNHAERFFCTLRRRCARLVRKALSFSKSWKRHLRAIRLFVANYNLSLLL